MKNKFSQQSNYLTKKISTKKEFSYSKDDVNLAFTLNVDDKKQCRSFKECLVAALKDIDNILETI